MDRGVFVQRQVSPDRVVVGDVGFEDAAEVGLAEDDDMIETLPPYRADQPFDVSVLPRRSRCRRSITDAHALEASADDVTIDCITISDQVAWSFGPRKCIGDVSSDPFCRRMGRHAEP